MTRIMSMFVFVALLAMAGRAEAYDYRGLPDPGGTALWGTVKVCTTASQCGTASAGYKYFCDYRTSTSSQTTCILKKMICGPEQNSTVVYNNTTGYCEFTCTTGTSYDPVQDACVPCASDTCCIDGTVYQQGEGYCGNSLPLPDSQNLYGSRYVCTRNVTTGKTSMVYTPCQYDLICDLGAVCTNTSVSCSFGEDCVGIPSMGWCEHTSSGTWTYAEVSYEWMSINDMCSMFGTCRMSKSVYHCNSGSPLAQERNACLCAQSGG